MIESRECPAAPVQENGSVIRCSMGPVETGSQIIKFIDQCSRCGWVDPASLDRWAEHWYKSRLDMTMARTALAAVGEPFAFVRGSERDLTLSEAVSQALAAATAMGQGEVTIERAQQIHRQLMLFIGETTE